MLTQTPGMNCIKILVALLLLSHSLSAQKNVVKVINPYAAIDKKALQIPDSSTRTTDGIARFITSNFETHTEKVRAIFVWIASNIDYDIDNMFAINFYEKPEQKIAKPLTTHKGICENYAALFNDVCSKCAIKSFVVEGYTKQNGFADYIPHAWCAAQLDSSWFLFDPTWGSGYISNNKFIKKVNNYYFKVQPYTLLKSHMPFDYLWQFVNYPITNQEFYEGKTQPNKTKAFFNYADSIKAYESLILTQQLKAASERIERNGVKNSLIFDRLQHLKLEIENDKQLQMVTFYNTAVAYYNDGINTFNNYIQYRNKQFTPVKTDAEIQSMIDSADIKMKDAKTKLNEIKEPDTNISLLMVQLTKSINDAASHVSEQQDWLKTYFSKGKSGRKSMFNERKITWFGIPLN